jgi:ABC-type multidrug transport system fused ATPase/permease subunit
VLDAVRYKIRLVLDMPWHSWVACSRLHASNEYVKLITRTDMNLKHDFRLIFRGVTNTLIKAQAELKDTGKIDMDWFVPDMRFYASMYFVQAVAAFTSGYCAMACFFTVCENQVNRMRKHFLKRILNQEMSFFDTNEVGKLTQKMSSGIDRIRDGTSGRYCLDSAVSSDIVENATGTKVYSLESPQKNHSCWSRLFYQKLVSWFESFIFFVFFEIF